MLLSLKCPTCGEPIDAEVEIVDWPEPSSLDYPGSGAVWHCGDVECDRCGAVSGESMETYKPNDISVQERCWEGFDYGE